MRIDSQNYFMRNGSQKSTAREARAKARAAPKPAASTAAKGATKTGAATKTAAPAVRAATAPSRERGRLRVEALLAAAARVFAAKGYAHATMTEVAAEAESSIGSLYQFFPTKDALAHELMRGMMEDLDAALGAIHEQAAALSTEALADALSHALVRFRQRHPAFAQLLDTPVAAPEFVVGVRKRMRAQLAAILRMHAPALTDAAAATLAIVVQQVMKSAVNLPAELSAAAREGALKELQRMLVLYLQTMPRRR